MTQKTCPNGHIFEKTSDCPTCPTCATEEITLAYANGFPKIGAPAYRALKNNGVGLADLPKYSEKQLLEIHGVGPKAVEILRMYLKEKGLAFADELK